MKSARAPAAKLRFKSKFGYHPFGMPEEWQNPWGIPNGGHLPPTSPGALLGRIESLIIEGQQQLKTFTKGHRLYFVYTEQLRGKIQRCLLDVGDKVREELNEINAIDFSPSADLRSYYARNIFNDFEAPGDTEFLRLQKEYDTETPPKIQRMIDLSTWARGKMLGTIPPTSTPTVPEPKVVLQQATQHKPYSKRDHALYELIGPEDLARLTDAELWKRKAKDFRKMQPLATINAFRARLFRIRRHYGVPAPKP